VDYLAKQKTVSALIAAIQRLDGDFQPLIDEANKINKSD